MENPRFGIAFAVGVAAALLNGCATPAKPSGPSACVVTDLAASPSVDGSTESENDFIRLRSIKPAPQATLTADSVLEADLDYAIKDFAPDRYEVLAQFDTVDVRRTTDGTFRAYPVLRFPAGRLHFCYPLMHIWSRSDVTRPLRVRFLLNRILDERSSRMLVRTDTLTYPTAP